MMIFSRSLLPNTRPQAVKLVTASPVLRSRCPSSSWSKAFPRSNWKCLSGIREVDIHLTMLGGWDSRMAVEFSSDLGHLGFYMDVLFLRLQP
jgi:hypothetical protein